MEENWAHTADQCRLQTVQFLVHLIDLLSVFLRFNGFFGIQKAVVDQTGSRPPDSDHDPFLVQVWLWEVLWSLFLIQPLSWSSPVVIYNPLLITRHMIKTCDRHMVHHCCIEEEKMTPHNDDIFDLWSTHETPPFRAFSPFQFASNAK